jgi:pimeloyl-ACP methyl ester carboxylesterase
VVESGIARFDHWIERMGWALEQVGADLDRIQESLKRAFDQESKLKAFDGPALVLHAPHDEIVPVEHGKQLAAWGDPSRTKGHILRKGGHNDIHFVNREEYFEVLGEFVRGLTTG